MAACYYSTIYISYTVTLVDIAYKVLRRERTLVTLLLSFALVSQIIALNEVLSA